MLPYVDDFLPVRNLANLEMIMRELNRVDWKRTGKPAHLHYVLDDLLK